MTRFFTSAVRFAILAALGATLGVLIGVAGGSLHWTFDFAAQFLLPSIFVAAGAGLAALLFRWPRLALAGAIVSVAAYATAAPWTSQPTAVAKDATRFSVLLFNIFHGNGQLPAVREMIERTNPDMVVLVEMTGRIRNKIPELIAKYPYRLDCTGTARCDIMVLSRARLAPREVKETSDPQRSPLLVADTEIAGCKLTLFATHMTRPFPKRPFWAQRSQAEEIGSDVAAASGAKLVLGDFNGAPWGYVVQTIAKRGGVSVLTGGGGTWPSFLPAEVRIPIDNMLVGPGLSFVSRSVLPQIGSDHAPVLAEIAVTDRTQCRQ